MVAENNKHRFSKLKRIYHANEPFFLMPLVLLVQSSTYFATGLLRLNKSSYSVSLPLDNAIPFIPFFILFYISLYFFGAIPFLVIKSRRYVRNYAKAYIFASIFSFLIFITLPIKMEHPEITGTTVFDKLTQFIYDADVTDNAFPSVHICLTLLTMIALSSVNNAWKAAGILWGTVIIFSTLFVKQHYLLDIVGGLLVGTLAYLLFLRKDRLLAKKKETFK